MANEFAKWMDGIARQSLYNGKEKYFPEKRDIWKKNENRVTTRVGRGGHVGGVK